MSTATMRLRRAGAGGLAAAVVAGTLVVTAGLASAATIPPAAGTYKLVTAGSATTVYPGLASQAAADVVYWSTNNFATNATATFTIAGNDCSTAAGIAAARSFSAAPTATISPVVVAATGAATTLKTPVATGALGSSTTTCATAGVKDTFTLTFPTPADTPSASNVFSVTLSGIKYTIGASSAATAVSLGLAVTGGLSTPGAAVVNATVAWSKLAISTVAATKPGVSVALGTITATEVANNAFIGVGATQTITLTLNGGALFTAGVTPTVTVPAGYTVVAGTLNATTHVATYAFDVHAPATAAKATITVAGLKADAAAAGQYTLSATGSTAIGAAQSALSVVSQVYTGGSDRYATAALLFAKAYNGQDAILASGANFPDALSANYLASASQLDTGILLTTPLALPSATRNAILTNNVKTVYIVGGPGAVSQSVEDQIAALHVGNVPTAAFINVVRIAGADRYGTNLAVTSYNLQTHATAIVATGAVFADALSAGPAVAGLSDPLVLTTPTALSASAMTALQNLNVQNVVIVGGTGAVSTAVETAIKNMGINVARLAGTDRTQTAAAIATWLVDGATPGSGTFTDAQGFGENYIYISRGDVFADALAGGPVAGQGSDVILLTNSPTSLGTGIPSFVAGRAVTTLNALGLSGAVSPAVLNAAAAAVAG